MSFGKNLIEIIHKFQAQPQRLIKPKFNSIIRETRERFLGILDGIIPPGQLLGFAEHNWGMVEENVREF